METAITSKGQVVIPALLRKKYGLLARTRLQVIDDGGEIILRPITPSYVRKLRGFLKGNKGLKALAEDRRRERNL